MRSTCGVLLLLAAVATAAELRVDTGHQVIEIDGRDPYLGYFTHVKFDRLTCVRALTIHCLRPLTGAEEIDLLFSECAREHWLVVHYTNSKEQFLLKEPVLARQLIVASRAQLTVIDVQVASCLNETLTPKAICRPARDHPRRHSRVGPLRATEFTKGRRKRAVGLTESLDFDRGSDVDFLYDKIVPRGQTMTVHRGSTMRFGENVGLIVYGSLIIKGTKSAPVRFQAFDSDSPWKGIHIIDGMPASSLSFANISGSQWGLWVEGGINPTIENVVVDSNENGIQINSNSSDVRLLKATAINNAGSGIELFGKASFLLDGCISASNQGNGIEIKGSEKARLTQCNIFSNQQTGVHLKDIANAKLEETVVTGNGAGIRVSRNLKTQIGLELLSSNVSGHHYGPAIVIDDGYGIELTVSKSRIHDNYNGGIIMKKEMIGQVQINMNNFTRNRGSTISIEHLKRGNVEITQNTFHANHLNEYSKKEAVIIIATEATGDKDNLFTKNIMSSVVDFEKNSGFEINMTLEECDLHGNLAHTIILVEPKSAIVKKNFLHNVQATCEITSSVPNHAHSALNYWGYDLQRDILARICQSNESLASSSYTVDEVVQHEAIQSNPLQPFNQTYNRIAAASTPYTIDEDVIIQSNETVIIDPGAKFYFAPGVGITVQERGKLIVNGTSADQIEFVGSQGSWRGIVVKPGGTLDIRNTLLADPAIGVWLDSDRINVDNITMERPVVHGFEVTTNSGEVVDLGASTIRNALGTAVAVDERTQNLTLRNFSILTTSTSGIDFVSPSGHIELSDITVNDAGSHAIHLSEFSSLPLDSVRLNNITVADQTRGHAGILLSAGWIKEVEIDRFHGRNNMVPNIVLAIECNDLPSITHITNSEFVDNVDTVVSMQMGECGGLDMNGNVFERNNGNGRRGAIRFDAEPKPGLENLPVRISNNDFIANGGEYTAFLSTDGENRINGSFDGNRLKGNVNAGAVVIVATPSFSFTNNRFENPRSTYQMETRGDGSYITSAINNWWGTNDQEQIAQVVKAPEGTVRISPFLTSAGSTVDLVRSTVPPIPTTIAVSTTNECSHLNFCSHKGECLGSLCVCNVGYIGPDCSIEVGCPKNCSQNGICNVFNNCYCYEGWTSSDCSIPICAFDCGGHGKCVSKDECECEAEFTGEFCLDIACSEVTCFHGHCENKTCECDEGFRGKRCDVPICEKCSLNGECVAPNFCKCFTDWGGEDCSLCVGESCSSCDLDCDHGVCDVSTRTCTCSKGWSGAACDLCPTGGCSTYGIVEMISPSTVDREDVNTVVSVFGKYFPKVPDGKISCIFGSSSTQGLRDSSSVIRCPTPSNMTFGRHVFSIAVGDESFPNVGPTIHFTVYDECLPKRCMGTCVGPLCLCPKGRTGAFCEVADVVVDINSQFLKNQAANVAQEGTPYVVYLPNMPGTLLRVNTSIPDLHIDSARGLLEWADPVGSETPYSITVIANSLAGETSMTWNLTVKPSYLADIESIEPQGSRLLVRGKAIGEQVNNVPILLTLSQDGAIVEQHTTHTNPDGSFDYGIVPKRGGAYRLVASHPGMSIEGPVGQTFKISSQKNPRIEYHDDRYTLRIPDEDTCTTNFLGSEEVDIDEAKYDSDYIATLHPHKALEEQEFVIVNCTTSEQLLWIEPESHSSKKTASPDHLIFLKNSSRLYTKIAQMRILSPTPFNTPISIESSPNVISLTEAFVEDTGDNSEIDLNLLADVSASVNGSLIINADGESVLTVPFSIVDSSDLFSGDLFRMQICVRDRLGQSASAVYVSLSVTNLQFKVDLMQNNVVVNGKPVEFWLKEGIYLVSSSSPLHESLHELVELSPHNSSICFTLTPLANILPALLDEKWATRLIIKPKTDIPYLDFAPEFVSSEGGSVLVTVKGNRDGMVSPKFSAGVMESSVQTVHVNDSFWMTVKPPWMLPSNCDARIFDVPFAFKQKGSTEVVVSSSPLIVTHSSSNMSLLCDESGKKHFYATTTSVLCDCSDGARAKCRDKYRSALACSRGWNRIPDDTVSLQVLSTFLLLTVECRDVGINFSQISEAMDCILSLESECPLESRRKRETSPQNDGPSSIINHLAAVSGQVPLVMQPQMMSVFNAMEMQNIRMAALYKEFFNSIQNIFSDRMMKWVTRNGVDELLKAAGDYSEAGAIITESEFGLLRHKELALLWNATVDSWQSGREPLWAEAGISYDEVKHLVATADRLKSFTRQMGGTDPFTVLHEYVGHLLKTSNRPKKECAEATIYITPSVLYEGGTLQIKAYIINTHNEALSSLALEMDIVPDDPFTPPATLVASGIGVNTNRIDGVLAPGSATESRWVKRIMPSKKLTALARYQAIILVSFTVDGRTTKQRLKTLPIDVYPTRSAKIAHFIFRSISKNNPFSVMSSIMNIGYSTLQNVVVHNIEVLVENGNGAVKHRLDSVSVNGQLIDTKSTFPIGTIQSGESSTVAVNLTADENARVTHVSLPISVDGDVIAVDESYLYYVEAEAGPHGLMVSTDDGTNALYYFQPETATITNVLPIAYASSEAQTVHDPTRTILLAVFRNTEPRGLTGFLWGSMPLPQLAEGQKLVRVVEKASNRRDRQLQPITWIDHNTEPPTLHFIDSSSVSTAYQLNYEFTFADPAQFSVPTFSQSSYRIQLIPDAWWPPIGSAIGQITADSAESSSVHYQLFAPDGSRKFSVDETSGSIVLEEPVQPGEEACLVLVAKDEKGQEARVPVAVNTGGSRRDCILFNTDGLSPLVSHFPVPPTFPSLTPATVKPTDSQPVTLPTDHTNEPLSPTTTVEIVTVPTITESTAGEQETSEPTVTSTILFTDVTGTDSSNVPTTTEIVLETTLEVSHSTSIDTDSTLEPSKETTTNIAQLTTEALEDMTTSSFPEFTTEFVTSFETPYPTLETISPEPSTTPEIIIIPTHGDTTTTAYNTELTTTSDGVSSETFPSSSEATLATYTTDTTSMETTNFVTADKTLATIVPNTMETSTETAEFTHSASSDAGLSSTTASSELELTTNGNDASSTEITTLSTDAEATATVITIATDQNTQPTLSLSTTPTMTSDADACRRTNVPVWNLICELSKTVVRQSNS